MRSRASSPARQPPRRGTARPVRGAAVASRHRLATPPRSDAGRNACPRSATRWRPPRGVVTGCNRAFVIDRATRDAHPRRRSGLRAADPPVPQGPRHPALAAPTDDRYLLLIDRGYDAPRCDRAPPRAVSRASSSPAAVANPAVSLVRAPGSGRRAREIARAAPVLPRHPDPPACCLDHDRPRPRHHGVDPRDRRSLSARGAQLASSTPGTRAGDSHRRSTVRSGRSSSTCVACRSHSPRRSCRARIIANPELDPRGLRGQRQLDHVALAVAPQRTLLALECERREREDIARIVRQRRTRRAGHEHDQASCPRSRR